MWGLAGDLRSQAAAGSISALADGLWRNEKNEFLSDHGETFSSSDFRKN